MYWALGQGRVDDGRLGVLAQVGPQPADALALDHLVAVDELFDALDGRPVPAQDDLGLRRVQADEAGHLAGLDEIRGDERDADDVVSFLKLADEALPGWESPAW